MSYLLDTDVVSEWVKLRPAPSVVRWLVEVDEDLVYLSVVTLAELRHGVDRLPHGRRRARLDEWLTNELPTRFEGRVLPIDAGVANAWGALVASRDRVGRPMGVTDAWLAATAVQRGLTLVTRNARDFRGTIPSVFDPWA